MTDPSHRSSPWNKALRRVEAGAQNAIELARLGRLTPRRGAPYEVVARDRTYKLRHYTATASAGKPRLPEPILLVPPLMLTAEIWDVSSDISVVSQLTDAGVDVWVCDFGSPEEEEGGLERTLDDHVRAVAACVSTVRHLTEQSVHLAGYSQGGMFCYQAAAYLRSEGLASIITFGSPVDIHKNLPGVREDVAAELIRAARAMVEYPLQHVEGLPGFLTSTAFKLLSVRKELQQMVEFVGLLHDRQALEKREARRRFLNGEGFVAWPGPALRKFVDEFIVNNRLASGGFVIDGRTVSLADITCPILAFVGLRDEIARPASVRSVRDVVPDAEVFTIHLKAGHFGLVVGSTAGATTWPAVIDWLQWRAGRGPRPELIPLPKKGAPPPEDIEDAAFVEPLDFEIFYDTAVDAATAIWRKLGDATRDVGDAVDNLRWQVPRLSKLERLRDESRISFSLTLAEQAKRIPEQTFFLWKGRAFTYGDADRRVDAVVRGLVHVGVQPGQRVGVVMRGRPSLLSTVTALNRLGASAVLINPDLEEQDLRRALAVVPFERLVTDPESATRLRQLFTGEVLVLGGGGEARDLGAGVVDLERIDPEQVRLPGWYRASPGLAREVALVFVQVPPGGAPRAARITNGRWAFSALGAAAACTLTPKDTVYCCLPLHHPAGLLVSVGGALVSGARLALTARFDEAEFWPEVRRYGVTVVFYAGTLCRRLVNVPPAPGDGVHSLRLFAGSGVRADVWQRLIERFGPVGVLEFYASTEGNVVLANARGEKVGAVGRPLPGSAEVAIVRYDFARGELVTDPDGRLLRSGVDEPGVLVSRVDDHHPPPPADLGPDGVAEAPRVLRDAFQPGDTWFVSSDVMRRDAEGDYWLLDRASDVIRTSAGWVAPRFLEDTVYGLPGVAFACAYGVELRGALRPVVVVAIVPRAGDDPDAELLTQRVNAKVPRDQRPRFVRFVDHLPVNDGFRLMRGPLRAAGVRAPGVRPTLVYDVGAERYVELDDASYERALAEVT